MTAATAPTPLTRTEQKLEFERNKLHLSLIHI